MPIAFLIIKQKESDKINIRRVATDSYAAQVVCLKQENLEPQVYLVGDSTGVIVKKGKVREASQG